MVWSIGSSCCTSLASWVHSNGYYDLLLSHHRLGIVALHVPLPGLHDAAVRVGGAFASPVGSGSTTLGFRPRFFLPAGSTGTALAAALGRVTP